MVQRTDKTAVITGVTGQDGYYLTEHLLELGYKVVGIDRRTSLPTTDRLTRFMGTPNFTLIRGDVTDLSSVQEVVSTFKPDEFYHLAAQSHVGVSWKTPIATCDITGMGTLNCLEALRKFKPDCRFYFAGSSEQFGNSLPNGRERVYVPGIGYRGLGFKPELEQIGKLNEYSPMHPESPYAAAKVFGYNICQVYRRSYDMFTACGILFNHESPIRGKDFVTRKITRQLAEIAAGQREFIELGNMDSCRDWGFAGDYVRAMHAMLQLDEPDDFVIAIGETYSVQEFFEIACRYFKLDPERILRINEAFIRPKDVDVLIGDSSKARDLLGWKPECSFEMLVELMCQYDECLLKDSVKAEQYLFPEKIKNG